MSTPYGYDEFDANSGAGEPDQSQGPKWFRDYMEKVSGQLKEIQAENESLKAEKRQNVVADTLRAKGYEPGAAVLFTGEPEKLDDWLKNYGSALAKLPTTAPEGGQEQQEQAPAGPPATTVPAQDQQAMQAFSEAGAGAAPPAGSDAETAARIAAIKTPQEYAEYMRSQGNQHDW
ncbi:hypothetical protein [Streptomyces sp. MP131-18]|uniref:hypothetical protein n=1 Tax=Streptomyces sp. MP131-18 TaxID=1857892 RepID=UPI00097BEC77|nr:hypothetical protein [Streptomyces sp. MP131-18]ONK10378.1 hypothetical protein STBA_11000 [Streptomyces sp. MP131-18]